MKKRILSIVCVVVMLAAMLPMAVSAEVIGSLAPFDNYESYDVGKGFGASAGYDALRNNSTSGAVNVAQEENGNKYLYAANANANGCNLVYYSSTYTLAAKSSLEIKASIRTADALNSIAFYFRSGLSGTLNSFNFLTISSSGIAIHRNAIAIPVNGYKWTAGKWHDITYRWNYATGYAEITIVCDGNVYTGSIENVGATIGNNTMGGIEIVAGNVLNIDNFAISNITAPFVAKTVIDDNFDDLNTNGWTAHTNGTLSAVEYDGRKCLKAANDIAIGYYQPFYDCADITSDMGAVYLETDFKLVDNKGGFDIRYRDAKDIKMFNVSAKGMTEVPYCGNMFVGIGEDAGWYTLKLIYNFKTKFAYVNISNEDGVNFTSKGTYSAGPSNLYRLELVLWSGSTAYFDNIVVKTFKEEDVPDAGLSKYFSFNDLEDGDVIGTADKEDGTCAYYGWYHKASGDVTAEAKDGRNAIALQTNGDADSLVCEKYVLSGDIIETEFMFENLDGNASLQVAGSDKVYGDVISIVDGKIVAGETEVCDFESGTWYRAIIKRNGANADICVVNLKTGVSASAQCALSESVNVLGYFGINVADTDAKLYVDNFLVSSGAKNLSVVVNNGENTVFAQDGLYIYGDTCNFDPSASSVLIDGAVADFDVTPWGGIKVKNLPEDETFTLTYALKDYNGNLAEGTATITAVNAYDFTDLDLYDENGDVMASVYGKVNASGKTAQLFVAVYSADRSALIECGVRTITSTEDKQDYVVRAGIDDYDPETYAISAFLWGEDLLPIDAIK